MLEELFVENVKQIRKDSHFRKLNGSEVRIEYIFEKYIKRNTFRERFNGQIQYGTFSRKSYENSKYLFQSANEEFNRICQEIKGKNLDPNEKKFQFELVLNQIERAIIYAPHMRQENQMNILIDAYILKLRILLESNLSNDFMEAYTIALSLIEGNDSRLKFKNDVNEWLPDYISEMLEDLDDSEGDEQTEYMPSLRIDIRCVFVTHPQRGRYMIAKENIRENEVLVSERPQIMELIKEKVSEYCSYCFEKLSNSFYPCSGCVECRFCGKNCAQNAREGFHKFECTIVGYITAKFPTNWLKGYRVLTSLGIDNINQLYERFVNNGRDFRLDKWIRKYNNQLVRKNQFEMIHQYKGLSTFVEHSYRNSVNKNISEIFIGIEIALLIEDLKVFKDLSNEQNFIRLVSMLIMHYNRCNSNAFAWSDGTYMALVSTMINHSCVPNARWSLTDGKIIMTTNREIKAGEEISISYGVYAFPNYRPRHEFLDRQLHLRTGYNFVCDCSWNGNGCKWDKRNVICYMKCRICSGTVYLGQINPQRRCADCGRIDENKYFYDNYYDNVILVIIDGFNRIVERDVQTERTIFYAEQLLELMSKYCDHSSPDLLRMRRTMDSIHQLFQLPFGRHSDTERIEFFQ